MNSQMVFGFSSSQPSVTTPPLSPTPSQRCLASPSSRARAIGKSVAAALEGRSRLLVFDNCEHVLDAAADLVELILAAIGNSEDPG